MKQAQIGIAGLGIASLALGAFLLLRPAPGMQRVAPKPSPLEHANAAYATEPVKAQSEYETFVAKNAKSKDPEIQDHVGAAQMRLGYFAAKRKDLPAARQTFLAAAQTKGTGAMGEFGTVGDQAAYQAVVCLVAEGKDEEAKRGFENYLRERPLSSLARAAYRRLARLNGGESTPAWDELMQTAVTKQEAHIRFETSVCGPKCIEHLLSSPLDVEVRTNPKPSPLGEGRVGVDYRQIAKLCGTTDNGTTVEGMRKGLKALGKESWAAKLNRQDLVTTKLPAILLEGDHYVLIQKIEGDAAVVWDPRFKSERPMKLPKLDDPDFSITLILLSKPEGI